MNINRGAAKEKQEGTNSLSYPKLSRKRPSWMPDIKGNKASAELSFDSTRREMNSGKETDNKGVNNRCRANTRGGNQAKRTNGGEEGRARLKTGLPPALTGARRPGRQICLTILN